MGARKTQSYGAPAQRTGEKAWPTERSRIEGPVLKDALRIGWQRLNFFSRCCVVLLVALIGTMPLLATWVNARVERAAVDNAAISSAQYFEPLLGPTVERLTLGTISTNEANQKLGSLLSDTTLDDHVLEIKIWSTAGAIIASSKPNTVGRKPPLTEELRDAIGGRLASHFDDTHHAASAEVRALGRPIFEIYAPIFGGENNKVLAVIEFCKDATRLKHQLANAGWHSWGIMIGLTSTFALLLVGIFHHGGTVIGEQQAALHRTLVDRSALAAQNNDLKTAIAQAQALSADITDKAIRRLGADLHDGPAQILTLALMQLDELDHKSRSAESVSAGRESAAVTAKLRSSLQTALKEVRDISADASLPELDNLSASDVVRLSVHTHRERTSSDVVVSFDGSTASPPLSIKTCIYRVVQEGLTNAFRHGLGKCQSVRVAASAEAVEVTVSDSGPGFARPISEVMGQSLGLQGLKHRVEALGGSFDIASAPARGVRLVAVLPSMAHQG